MTAVVLPFERPDEPAAPAPRGKPARRLRQARGRGLPRRKRPFHPLAADLPRLRRCRLFRVAGAAADVRRRGALRLSGLRRAGVAGAVARAPCLAPDRACGRSPRRGHPYRDGFGAPAHARFGPAAGRGDGALVRALGSAGAIAPHPRTPGHRAPGTGGDAAARAYSPRRLGCAARGGRPHQIACDPRTAARRDRARQL